MGRPPSTDTMGSDRVELSDFAATLRQRWRILVAAVLAGLCVAVAVVLLATPRYEASAELFVSTQTAGASSNDLLQGSSFTQQRVKSYAALAKTPAVLQPVVDQLQLHTDPASLADSVTASSPTDTVLIDLAVRSTSPDKAARIANAVAEQFRRTVEGIERPSAGGPTPVSVTVVQQPTVPTGPVYPNRVLDIGLGLIVGLGIGVGLALLRQAQDRSVRAEADVAALTDAPVLGSIAFDAAAADRPLVVQGDPHGPRSEAFRALRTNLQFVAVGNRPRSVVVTSSVPGEGKSTTTANLACTMAAGGRRVAVVEADLRRPRLAHYLGLEDSAGLTDVLIGRASLDEVLQPWGSEGTLSVLGCGPIPPNPSELLGSEAMGRVLSQLLERVDHVLIDAPPLLPFTDAAVLSRMTDGTLMVVGSDRIDRDGLRRALDALTRVDTNLLGIVMNLVPPRATHGYEYGYGYGYGYGSLGEESVAPNISGRGQRWRAFRERRSARVGAVRSEAPR